MKVSSWLVLFLSVIIISSCNKDDVVKLTIAGKVEDPKALLNQSVAGVELKLLHNSLEGGVFSNSFSEIMSVTSGANGAYQFEFDRDNTISYKITGQKTNYFDLEVLINPDNIDPGTTYTKNLSLKPKAHLSMNIVNSDPEGPTDQITFQYLNANFNCSCCDNDDLILTGTDVDTTDVCALEGNSWIKYYYIVDKPSLFLSVLDSVYCNSFDTTYVQIGY